MLHSLSYWLLIGFLQRSKQLLEALLPPSLYPAIPFVNPYFMTSFGSFQRVDYGTGHETSFAFFLLCLTLLRFYNPEPDEERRLVLRVFERCAISRSLNLQLM